MSCSTAAAGLLLLVAAALALAALLASRATAARLTSLAAEVERLRELSQVSAARVAGLAADVARLSVREARGAPRVEAAPGAPEARAAPRVEVAPEALGVVTGPAPAAISDLAAGATTTRPSGAPAIAAPGPAAQPGPLPAATTAVAGTTATAAAAAATAAAAAAVTPPPAAAAAAAAPAAPRRTPFEELVGARLQVWIGAMALALAGAFLVKISFERGWISPPVRVATGVAFGIALLALAEGLRRSSGRISEALAAAGIADLFACFLAAVHLYHLVPPAAGFLLMGLTTAVAVAMALRQGVMVALIGLVGGFLTPALIQTHQPSARNLFGYLLLLIAGLLAVAWRRRWRWLAIAALASGLLWAAVWLAHPFLGGDAAWLSLFLVALAAGATLPPISSGETGPGAGRPAPGGAWPPRASSMAMLAAALAVLAGTVSRSGYAPAEWGFLALLAAGALALAWLDPRYQPLSWIAAGTTAALLAAWGRELTPADSDRFLITALAGGGLFALAGWAAALAGRPSWRPTAAWSRKGREGEEWREPAGNTFTEAGPWAALSAAAGVLFFLVAWHSAHVAAGWPSEAWAGVALAAAALYLAGAVPVARLRRTRGGLAPALAALAVAVTSLVSISVPLALGRESFAAAWALEAAALVWLAGRLCLPALVVLARLLAPVAVLGALLSGAEERARGQAPLWNELLYAYGVPLLALGWAAWMARRDSPLLRRPERPLTSPLRLAAELEWQAVALGFALLTLEIRQLFQPAAPWPEANAAAVQWDLARAGALACSWLLYGLALLWANRRLARGQTRRSLELAGRLVILLGLAAVLAGPCLADNPLWDHQLVGATPLLNVLAAAYALPAILAIAAAAEVRRHGGRRLPLLASTVALLLGFVWISLTVRQLFHGAFLDRAPAGAPERYAYSAAWVLYGIGLLLAGIARRGPILRFGSLAVMLLAVAKVFLYDTARLSDLYRVLSFLGLGASLLLLGFLYQRHVFRPAGGEETGA
ncbi:MAG TPA: DUF2339 domain-containing protein [Thermoanaerobaculia bacterium]